MFLSRSKIIAIGILLSIFVVIVCEKQASPKIEHPLRAPIFISGSFSEFRLPSRFHHGLDYKTFNRVGIPVEAPLDGYISKVHVSERGYGNALFLSSEPNITFTFGHLQDFNGDNRPLEEFRQALELLHPKASVYMTIPAWFRFKKQEVLGLSGESGSGAPHLHFEIKEGDTYFDPLSWGLSIPDTTAPELQNFYVEDSQGITSYASKLSEESSMFSDKRSKIYTTDVITVPPNSRFLLGGYDTMAARNRNGVRKISLKINNKTVYQADLGVVPEKELDTAAQYYHAGRTVIGVEYVYYLYKAKDAAVLTEPGTYQLEATLEDSSGNFSTQKVIVEVKANVEQKKAVSSMLPVSRVRGRTIDASYGGGSVRVTYAPFSIAQDAFASLKGVSLPAELLQSKNSDTMLFKAAGPAFELKTKDLYYTRLVGVDATFPDMGGFPGLYLYNATSKNWRLLALPKKRGGGKVTYSLSFRNEGMIAQLIDLSPPKVIRPMLWENPENQDSSKNFFIREYMINDIGSGIALYWTEALLDGKKVPFEYISDRETMKFTIPKEIMSAEGSILSIKTKDLAGNESDWLVEVMPPVPPTTQTQK